MEAGAQSMACVEYVLPGLLVPLNTTAGLAVRLRSKAVTGKVYLTAMVY
jgi:hypothetical protein